MENYCVNAEKEVVVECLKTHNIRKLVRFIEEQLPDFDIDGKQASLLQGYNYETRYPGDNFFTATKEDVVICYEAVKGIEQAVHKYMIAREDALIKG